jgi:flagellar biogenesis protein FliO
MPRLAAILIATALAHAAIPSRGDESYAAPREMRAPSRMYDTRAASSQTLASDIIAPRSAVRTAAHETPITAMAPNQLAPRGGDAATLDLPDAPALDADREVASTLPGMGTVFACLCLVLGLFFLVAWLMRKTMPRASATLPAEVAEPLGRIMLAPRHHAHLIRIGSKLILVSISQAGAETLTEITDPLEVDRLAGICQQTREHSSTNAFRQVFEQFAAQKTSGGFLGGRAISPRDVSETRPTTRERSHG